jgi:hypothetical protein
MGKGGGNGKIPHRSKIVDWGLGIAGFQRGLVLTSGLKRGRLATAMSRCTFSSSDKLRVSSEIAVAELGTKRRNHGTHGKHGRENNKQNFRVFRG